jgi:hypothetical protein
MWEIRLVSAGSTALMLSFSQISIRLQYYINKNNNGFINYINNKSILKIIDGDYISWKAGQNMV